MITRADKLLASMRENTGFLVSLNTILSHIKGTGMLEFMRSTHQPRIIGLGADVQVQAIQGAFTAGYTQALDDIEEFRERYIEDINTAAKVQMDFGATDSLLSAGYISEDEANAIRAGKSPSYRTVIGNTPAGK